MIRMRNSVRCMVVPPFMSGIRNPLVAGLIRFNEDVSAEAKKVLSRASQSECLEVVSDDTLRRAHDRHHIEAGAGLLTKTFLSLGTDRKSIWCAVAHGFVPVGVNNDSKEFHANQARIVAEYYGEEWVKEAGGGVVVTAHASADDDSQRIVLSDGFQVVNELVEVTDMPASSSLANDIKFVRALDGLLSEEFLTLGEPQPNSLCHFVLKKSDESIIGGISVCEKTGNIIDPFITTDCPEGTEWQMLSAVVGLASKESRIRKPKFFLSTNDKYLHQLLRGSGASIVPRVVFSALPLNMNMEDQKQLRRLPWLSSSLLRFLPVVY